MARVLFMSDFSESYANKLLKGVIQYSHEHSPWVVGRVPLSLRDSNKLDSVLDMASFWKADAIIGQFRGEEDASIFSERGILTVAQDYIQPLPGMVNITGAYAVTGEMAARYFLEKGLRHFAFYGMRGVVWSDLRRDGFIREIEESSGIPFPKRNIREMANPRSGWWYSTDHLIHWLQSLPKPVGIFACDDNKANNIIEACTLSEDEQLSIPDNIMVLGVDNDETLDLLCHPQLSSVALDIEKAGYQMAGLIEDLIKLPPEVRSAHYTDIIVNPTHIVTRQSTEAMVGKNPYVYRVLRHIQNNLGNRLSVEDLVELVPMSRRTLEDTFFREMGSSIWQFIIRERVKRFRTLLDDGLTPLQASGELGLEYKVIARSFKRIMGVSPKEYVPKNN